MPPKGFSDRKYLEYNVSVCTKFSLYKFFRYLQSITLYNIRMIVKYRLVVSPAV